MCRSVFRRAASGRCVMNIKHLPSMLWTGLAVTVAALAAGFVRTLLIAGPSGNVLAGAPPSSGPPVLRVPAILLLIAYGLSFSFAAGVVADHSRGSRMRTAWLFVSASCGAGMGRYLFELSLTVIGGGDG